MKKISSLFLVLAVFLTTGCSKLNKEKNALEQPPRMQKFQRCITDAKTLSQLDQKFQKNAKELYSLVNTAKYYASVADSSSVNVSSTITPFFDYKLNEICNNISLLLITEFQRNAISAIEKNNQ
ncbi:hypothetical protein QP353_23820 [Klebsiella aerogenes]|uniref:hypothetical protein n=1 Tax=Klebsiella aerogenes TaxID=548 RepID=UPI00254D35DD|nr:hypothetical protein [Klebsiella aerogenes]MDK6932431.1 hypothetical protein [Klebsiella aerogenes]